MRTVTVLAMAIAILVLPLSASAISLSKPFGGKVYFKMKCTCQYTAWMKPEVVYVGPPNGGSFLKTIFTREYNNKSVTINHWVLGLSSSAKIPCMITAGLACANYGNYNFMMKVGTN